jgi:hypothetical protein
MKRTYRSLMILSVWSLAFCFLATTSVAFDGNPAILDLRYQPTVEYSFSVTPSGDDEEELPYMLSRIEPAAAPANEDYQKRKFNGDDDQDIKEQLIEKIPFGSEMHKSWKVIDGDVDLYFKGLRADRQNKGVEYSSKTLPFVGEMEKSEWKIDAGEDMKFTFETNGLPFVANVEGFHFKTSVSSDDTHAYAKYTIAFD